LAQLIVYNLSGLEFGGFDPTVLIDEAVEMVCELSDSGISGIADDRALTPDPGCGRTIASHTEVSTQGKIRLLLERMSN
jgi:hypothetical protein